MQGFKAPILDPDTGGAFIAVLFVNWNDTNAHNAIIDYVKEGIAYSPHDDCYTYDLWLD